MSLLALTSNTHRHRLMQRDQLLLTGVLMLLASFLLLLSMVSASTQRHLAKNLQSMLGSDMVLSQFQALSPSQEQALRTRADAVSRTRLLDINLSNGERWEPVQLKLVDSHYPIQGRLSIAEVPGGDTESVPVGPREGELWVGSRLLSRLGLRVGQNMNVGAATLRISAILHHEPDRLLEGHSVKLRALAHESTLASTDLASAGSRFRYLIAAGDPHRHIIHSWIQRELPDASLIDRHTGEHPLAGHWRRIENFFGLSAVLLFLIAAIAINMVARRQLLEQQRRFALYRSMGFGPSRTMGLALLEWLMTFVVAALPGVLLAYGLQTVVIRELQSVFPGIAWGWHSASTLSSLALLLALFLCLQMPLFYSLYRTSVIALMRQQGEASRPLGPLLWTLVTLAILAATYSDNWLLTGLILGSLLAAVVLMLGLTWLVLWAGERIGRHGRGLGSFVLFIMKSRAGSKTVQVMSLGLCATLLLFTLMLMRDIGDSMFSQTRSQNGNLIISETPASQIPAIEEWARESGSTIRDMRLFQRAQLTRINGRKPAEHAGHPSETLSVVENQIRLSWSGATPTNNRVIDGSWWPDSTSDWRQVSVEDEVMVDLELELGDVLTFRVTDQVIDLKIVARHAFVPGSSAVTFWFMAPPALMKEARGPVRGMGSMELPQQAWPQLAGLLARHPTLAVVSLRELTERFDATLAIVTRITVSYSFMVLTLSIAVLLASMICYEADDRQRNGLLKSMGISDAQCLRLTLYEWMITGMLAAVGAIAGTWLAGHLIYQSQFQLSYRPDPLWMVSVLGVCCGLVCVLGVFFSRAGLRTPVRQLLVS